MVRLVLLMLTAPAAGPIAVGTLPPGRAVGYEADIAPLFAAKCQVCHAGQVTEGDFALDTYAAVMKGGKRGPAVVPDKPDASFLWTSSSHRAKPIMPPKSEANPLTPAEVAIVRRWIELGAKGPAVDEKVLAKVVVGLPPAVVTPVRALAVRPDKLTVAAGRGNRVLLIDAKTGRVTKTLADPLLKTPDGKPAAAAHLSLVEAMAFSPDGATLATGSFREVTLWNVPAGTVRRRVAGFRDRVVALAFSPDGKLLAAGGGVPSEDGEIKLLDPGTGRTVRELAGAHSDTVFGVAFSPDGTKLATAGADKFVRLFAAADGRPLQFFEGHTQHVMDVGFTPDGKRLVSAGADNVVKVWDIDTGEKVRDLTGHTKQVTRLAFAPKAGTFLTASGDTTVRAWKDDGTTPTRTYTDAKDFVYAVAASHDGTVIAAGGEEGVVRLYDAAGKLVAAVKP